MIGKRIIELDRIDSTNAYANKLLMQGKLEEGDVIWSHDQFAGRGQHEHSWVSEAGRNLTFTVLFRPTFLAPDRQFLLNKVVSLAVVDFIFAALDGDKRVPLPLPSVSIKWPNDIYAGNLKIGGILVENKIMGSILDASLAGIGVNINQENFPANIPNPVSLIRFLGRETGLKDALLMICRCIDLHYNTLIEGSHANLDTAFDQHLLGFGDWRNFTCQGDKFQGKINGVNNLGNLLVETRSGEILCFNHGEVEYVL